jgi:hypothetical protein
MALVKLRKVVGPNTAMVRLDGIVVAINVRSLTISCEKAIQSALIFIKAHYRPDVLDVSLNSILDIARFVCFLQTDLPKVGGYQGITNKNICLVIINRELMNSKDPKVKRELAVTILHELLHFLHEEHVDKKGDSEFEAEFDLLCYKALNLHIPASHWAWDRLGIDVTKLMKAQ